MLISEAPIGSFTLKGAIGYLYAEQELNEICKIYGYGTGANTSKKFNYDTGDTIEGTTTGTITGSGAKSLNVEDVNKICEVTQSLTSSKRALITKSIYYPTVKTSTGKSNSTASRTDVITIYSYQGSNYLTKDTELYKMLFSSSNWLASRGVGGIDDNKSSAFCTYTLFYGSVLYGFAANPLCSGTTSEVVEGSSSLGIRPVVYLKSSIQTNGKNTDGAWNIIDK